MSSDPFTDYSSLKYEKAVKRRLREFGRDEKWLQDRITEDPSILGLGDLAVSQREKTLYKGGRIDLILSEPDEDVRYEVEIMLGAVDPSHIIRSIEYWDIERTRYPKLQHRAVIVAEEITSRFFNVISLLNRAVPMIAIQLSAIQVGGSLSIDFTKILDITELSTDEDEDEQEFDKVDRDYWQQNHPDFLPVMTKTAELIADLKPHLTYNKWHVAVQTTGRNFLWFHFRKNPPYCITEVLLNEVAQKKWVAALTAIGIPCKAKGEGKLTIQPTSGQIEANSETLSSLLREAEMLRRAG